ncbi:BLUF domain-containing protein [Glaciecola petra]|uniref:BLUF domain-containing protein n=1 Tax=Glaciecola petra TaxID=3075602 RepID=A0ABU2ZUG7_9ALTE|nr:BLUF domain-containing protein [Aestuariibacter sp. P117]MDT0596046.1 BLUF domain-containing protein [Aestuariibacter sp. P117]
MQVLAIARFTDEAKPNEYEKYLSLNHSSIVKLHNKGIIRAFWSRGDQPGTVLMLEVASVKVAYAALEALPLVEKNILQFKAFPLEPYQVSDLLPENDNILLVYVSAATDEMTDTSLDEILTISRRNNQKLGVSGMLLYVGGSFMQILEGPLNKVNVLYKKISKDTRHTKVAKVLAVRSPNKIFEDWTMGKLDAEPEEIQKIDGMNDFFQNDKCLENISEEQVKKILDAFKDGKWRQKLS